MRTEVIQVGTIDEAVQRILEELKEDSARSTTTRGRHNVIYFDGWDGLGASAVLRAVGRCLAPSTSEKVPAVPGRRAPPAAPGLEFFKIIHIDCSKWESRRATQRALAKKLGLPTSVMGMFNAQDEEDDYRGVCKESRLEIPEVADAIYQHVQRHLSHRFLVIFNNGSNEEINLDSLGFPLSGYSRNKALWSFQGGFRLYDRTKVDSALKTTRATDVVLSAASHPGSGSDPILSDILRYEAAESVHGINIAGIDWPAAAANCFLYTMKLCSMGSHLADYELATHGSNYWKCDGIIQLQQGDDSVDGLWLSCDALQREMRLNVEYYQNPYLASPVVRRLPESIPYWASPTYGLMLIQDGHIPRGMLQQFDKLHVLKLSACRFSFASPPFLYCHSLRFLWLDHCRDESSTNDGVENHQEDLCRCFEKLWVLDMRYSSSTFLSAKMVDFMTQLRELNVMGQDIKDIGVFQGRLHNIRKVRITRSFTTDSSIFLSSKDKMELLDLSGYSVHQVPGENQKWISMEIIKCSSLETVIIDGSISLQIISLNGCAKLKNLLLSGLFSQLFSLDISGTTVKTLDLSALVAPKLDKLFLLDSEALHAIIWPPQDKRKRYLGELRIDTTQKEGNTTVTTAAAGKQARPPSIEFYWDICARDARLLGSLAPIKDYFGHNDAYVEISTTTLPSPTRLHADAAGGNRIKRSSGLQAQGKLQLPKDDSIYADVTATFKEDTSIYQQGHAEDTDAWTIMLKRTYPPPPHEHISRKPSQGCYMHIEDQTTRTKVQTRSPLTVPGFVCDGVKILHVHSGLSITGILADPSGSSWNKLECCRVHHCPELEYVFSPQFGEGLEGSSSMETFKKLGTIWASHLRNARCILKYPGSTGPRHRAFADLTMLHLYCCPRLVYAVPLPLKTMSLESLETIKIMWCGDLNVAFHLYHETSDQGRYEARWCFPNLKHIHLHELPSLQGIFNIPWFCVQAPKLETIRIRGCWSLRTLPYVSSNNMVECDCEKEWWHSMKESYRRVLAYHYKLTHPRYYKKTMLRASALR